MDNCPFVDELSVKHGDFPFLCEMTRGYITYELTLLQYIYIFQHISIHQYNSCLYIYIYCMVTAPNDLDIFFGRPCFTPVAHIRTPFGKIGRRLVNQCDLEERSALCLAVIGRHSNMVQILLSSKVPSRGVGACFKGLGLGGLKGIYFYWPLAWWSWQKKQ